MTNESSKTKNLRGPAFFKRFLSGKVIDIGCGEDLVVPHAEPFDLEHGDAQNIAALRTCGTYDAVHSSHCLEHMSDPPKALSQWWALVKSGGYLVVVVPEENLYEQGVWPSVFNTDHKASFFLTQSATPLPRSYDISLLFSELPGCEIVLAEIQDQGYNYKLIRRGINFWGKVALHFHWVFSRVARKVGIWHQINHISNYVFYRLGSPIDQTLGSALAQIQIIGRKT